LDDVLGSASLGDHTCKTMQHASANAHDSAPIAIEIAHDVT